METIKLYLGKYPAKAKREVPRGKFVRSYNAGKQKFEESEADFVERTKKKFAGYSIEYHAWDNEIKRWMPVPQPGIRIGGLFRCCIYTAVTYYGLLSEGEFLTCKYCGESMVFRDGAWEWNNTRIT